MNLFSLCSQLVLWGLGAVLAMLVGYQLLLAIAACFAAKALRSAAAVSSAAATTHFAVLVPAHNEELLLPTLLKSLAALDYPRDLYTVFVVADNCSDRTAAYARQSGATVYERFDQHQRGKGYALQWLTDKLLAAHVPFHAVVILDADSVVSPNFLTVMADVLKGGAHAVQAYYTVRDPERAWTMRLRAAALALVHYVRPRGRMVIGGSVGLKGNGMVLRRTLLVEHRWSGSVTEDIDYHMALVLAGKRVVFAEEAVVWAEMPSTLQGAHSQNVRWEQGRLQLARRYVPPLLTGVINALRQADWRTAILQLDSVMEHLIPPFSVLLGLTGGYLLVALVVQSTAVQMVAILLLLGQLAYLLGGMLLAGTPWQTFLALRYVPPFLVWKLWLYVRILLRLERQEWVRTAR